MSWFRTTFLVLGMGALSVAGPALVAQSGPGLAVPGELGHATGDLERAQRELGFPGDPESIREFLLAIGLAVLLGTILAYHPYVDRVSSVEDVDKPKIIVTYTVVGALVAVVVAHLPAMALAVFGIGGLMRFRTELGAAKDTGRAILATLLGLTCGLQFWWVAVLGTLVAWLLIFVLEGRKGLRMVVRGLKSEAVAQAAEAYAPILRTLGCRFSTPRKNPRKGQISFVLRVPRKLERESIELGCQEQVSVDLRGTVDWPEE